MLKDIPIIEPAKKGKGMPRCEKINIRYQKVTSVILFSIYNVACLESSKIRKNYID